MYGVQFKKNQAGLRRNKAKGSQCKQRDSISELRQDPNNKGMRHRLYLITGGDRCNWEF